MNIVMLILVFAFVLSVLGLVGFTIFEISPFGRHTDHFRDPETGKRRVRQSAAATEATTRDSFNCRGCGWLGRIADGPSLGC